MKAITIILILFLHISCRTLGTIPLGNIHVPSTPSRPSHYHYNNEDVVKSAADNKTAETFTDYIHITSPADYLKTLPMKEIAQKNAQLVKFVNAEPLACDFNSPIKINLASTLKTDAQNLLGLIAANENVDTVHLKEDKYLEGRRYIIADLYNCHEEELIKPKAKDYKEKISHSDLDLLFGTYVNREGGLKKIGSMGPTLGFNFTSYDDERVFESKKGQFGWYLHFSFDHFYDTNSKLLKPKFTDENFTNYMWSLGLSTKLHLNDNFKFVFDIGPAINFLEIDTARTNYEISDEEATRTTFSLLHRASIYYKIKSELPKLARDNYSESYIGLSLQKYWMYDPLGDWARNNTDFTVSDGGSTALIFSYKISTY